MGLRLLNPETFDDARFSAAHTSLAAKESTFSERRISPPCPRVKVEPGLCFAYNLLVDGPDGDVLDK